jgi:hypothetical protein
MAASVPLLVERIREAVSRDKPNRSRQAQQPNGERLWGPEWRILERQATLHPSTRQTVEEILQSSSRLTDATSTKDGAQTVLDELQDVSFCLVSVILRSLGMGR